MKLLQQHMLEQHSRHLCNICIRVSICPDINRVSAIPSFQWRVCLTWQAEALLAMSARTA